MRLSKSTRHHDLVVAGSQPGAGIACITASQLLRNNLRGRAAPSREQPYQHSVLALRVGVQVVGPAEQAVPAAGGGAAVRGAAAAVVARQVWQLRRAAAAQEPRHLGRAPDPRRHTGRAHGAESLSDPDLWQGARRGQGLPVWPIPSWLDGYTPRHAAPRHLQHSHGFIGITDGFSSHADQYPYPEQCSAAATQWSQPPRLISAPNRPDNAADTVSMAGGAAERGASQRSSTLPGLPWLPGSALAAGSPPPSPPLAAHGPQVPAHRVSLMDGWPEDRKTNIDPL